LALSTTKLAAEANEANEGSDVDKATSAAR
jgi:hypothetical protein